MTTISSAPPSQRELMSGCLATAASSARATKSIGDTRTPAYSASSRTRRTAAIVSVTSTCRNSVTCGAVNALDTMAAAMCLRTPRIEMRSSVPRRAGRPVPAPLPDTEWPERPMVSPAAARCTSSRVIDPSGPVPASLARLMPRSLASLRTGGLARARMAGVAAAGVPAAGISAAGAAMTGTVLRARRLVDASLTPYPTRTAWRWGLSGAGATVRSAGLVLSWTEAVTAGASPEPATSTAMMGTPTSTVCPSSASSRDTVPSHGDGSSTTAFAVSISTMIWLTST